jgi:glycosyltransferase involved in cell wall biosynthesis
MARAAPIAIFIFNRPDHLSRTLASLRRCEGFDEAPIIVFGDGPKSDDQSLQVEAARAVARGILGDRAAYRFAERNKGLARSIIDGVNEVTGEHDRAIVVEDDLALAPGFLTYMNAALDRYAAEENVYQVSGHMFDVPEFASRGAAVMLPFTTTWGWATWARAWRHFDECSVGWQALREDRALRCRFNLGGVYDYATMLEARIARRRDSWGIHWYWSVFNNDGLAVFPPRSLVHNEGMDGSGSHGKGLFRQYQAASRVFPSFDFELPIPHCLEADLEAVRRTIWRQNGGTVGKMVDWVKKRALGSGSIKWLV